MSYPQEPNILPQEIGDEIEGSNALDSYQVNEAHHGDHHLKGQQGAPLENGNGHFSDEIDHNGHHNGFHTAQNGNNAEDGYAHETFAERLAHAEENAKKFTLEHEQAAADALNKEMNKHDQHLHDQAEGAREDFEEHAHHLHDQAQNAEQQFQEHAHHLHDQAEGAREGFEEHAHHLHDQAQNAEEELQEHAHHAHDQAENAGEELIDKAADFLHGHHHHHTPPQPLHEEEEQNAKEELEPDHLMQERELSEEAPREENERLRQPAEEEEQALEAVPEEEEHEAQPELEREAPAAEEDQEQQPEQEHEHEQQHEEATAPSTTAAVADPSSRPFHIRTQRLQVTRWEAAPYEPREDSEDEFEQSTCRLPICEGEEEEGEDNAAAAPKSQFKNGKPTCEGEIISCFDDPNLLYRIVNEKEKTWYFYNDSLNYEMHIEFIFGKNSKIEALGHTTLREDDNGSFIAELVVYPTETQPFIKGRVNGYTSKLRAVPLSDSYHDGCRNVTDGNVKQEIEAIEQVCDSKDAEDVLQACLTHGLPFVDPEFPPSQASLEAGAKKPFRPLAWARPQMYLPEDLIDQVRLFRCAVQPGMVEPGDLGDSWVMCSVAAVTEDPERLIGMFRHPYGKTAAQREHAIGAYRVTFNKNGWWRSVLVDDYLPISAGRPKFARSARDQAEIWPCILEKAFAKLHGSYAKICTGDPLHALHDMTGFSTFRFDDALKKGAEAQEDTTAADTAFDDLLRALEAGYTVVCSTPGKDASEADGSDAQLNEEYKNQGLLTGHAYTILDAKHLPEINTRLVKVRNAWGRGLEWSGDWCDSDPRWEQYPEVAEACNFTREADGTFWMPWESVLTYFNGGGVCYTHKPAYDYRINCAFNECIPSTVLDLKVTTPTWMTFVLSQEDRRCREEGSEYQPVMLSIAVPADAEAAEGAESQTFKVALNSVINGAQPSEEKWVFLQARDVSLIHKFQPGRYLVIPRLMPLEGQPEQVPFVLGVISNAEIGAGAASAEFCRLPAECRVFENYPKFDAELIPCDDVQYQKSIPGSRFPQTLTGAQIE